MRNSIFVLFTLLILTCLVQANEGTISPCSLVPYSVDYSPITKKLYAACSGSAETLTLSVIDPFTLQQEAYFTFNGLIHKVSPVDNGNALIVALSKIVGATTEESGLLLKVDYDTGEILNSLEFSKTILAMVVNPSETHAFLTQGLGTMQTKLVSKVNLANFEVSSVEFGNCSDEIKITNNGQKIYVKDHQNYGQTMTEFKFHVGIFRTSDLQPLGPLEIDTSPFSMEMGYDNRLYIFNFAPGRSSEDAITIVNTQNDTVIKTIKFADHDGPGIEFAGIDPIRHKLYGTVCEVDPQLYPRCTNKIIQINLDDPNYSHSFFTLGNEPLWMIAVASTQSRCRIFCTPDEGTLIHWVDEN